MGTPADRVLGAQYVISQPWRPWQLGVQLVPLSRQPLPSNASWDLTHAHWMGHSGWEGGPKVDGWRGGSKVSGQSKCCW